MVGASQLVIPIMSLQQVCATGKGVRKEDFAYISGDVLGKKVSDWVGNREESRIPRHS